MLSLPVCTHERDGSVEVLPHLLLCEAISPAHQHARSVYHLVATASHT